MKAVQCFIDFKSPASYLALNPTLKRLGSVAVEWIPFDSQQITIPESKTSETRGESHIRVRETSRRRLHQHYAEIQGIEMHFPAAPGSTGCALAALLYCRESPEQYLRAAYDAYWRRHLDLDDVAIVRDLLSQSGWKAEDFAPADFATEMQQIREQAEALGVFDTPMFVAGGQLFLGREHLPWIQSLALSAG